jgi:hypothetical protein
MPLFLYAFPVTATAYIFAAAAALLWDGAAADPLRPDPAFSCCCFPAFHDAMSDMMDVLEVSKLSNY